MRYPAQPDTDDCPRVGQAQAFVGEPDLHKSRKSRKVKEKRHWAAWRTGEEIFQDGVISLFLVCVFQCWFNMVNLKPELYICPFYSNRACRSNLTVNPAISLNSIVFEDTLYVSYPVQPQDWAKYSLITI
jgi:hypothetical protein